MGTKTGEALSNFGATLLDASISINKEIEGTKSSIRKYLIGSQIPHEVNRIYQQALNNPDSKAGLEEFQNSLIGFAKGFMNSVPEGEDQLYAGRLLAHTAQNAETHFKTEIKKQNTNVAALHLIEAIDKYQELANGAAQGGDLNSALAHQSTIAKLMFDGVKKGFIGVSSAHSIQKNIKKSIKINHYSGLIERAVKSGDIKTLEAIKQDVIDDKKISHVSKTSLLAFFSKIQGTQQLKIGMSEMSFKEFKDEVVFQAKTNGKRLTAEQIAYIGLLKPKNNMEIEHSVNDGIEIYNAVEQQRLLPLPKKADYLRQLDERIAKAESAREKSIYEEAKKIVQVEIDSAIKDPIKFISSNESTTKVIEEELKTYQNTPTFQALGETARQEALKQRKATLIIQLQKHLGLEPRLLSNEQAQTRVAELQATGFGNSLVHLQQELASCGPRAEIVLKDLKRAGLPKGLKYTLGASPSYQPILAKAFNSSFKDLKTQAAIGEDGDYKGLAIKRKIQNKIHDYVNTLPASETAELEQTVYTAVLQELAENHNETAAVNNAIDGIYEYKYQMIGNGYRIPKYDQNKQKIKSSNVYNKARHLSAKIPTIIDSLTFAGSQKLSNTQKAAMILDGKWRTMPDDRGLIYVTNNELPVKTKDGFNLAFYFSNLTKDEDAKAKGIKDNILNVFE